MTTASYAVTGMTCGYCMAEVMEHVRALVGVTGVAVDLVQDGPSPVVVTSGAVLRIARVREAVGEAGFDLTGELDRPTSRRRRERTQQPQVRAKPIHASNTWRG